MILATALGLLGLACLYCEFFLPGGVLAILALAILVGSLVLFFLQADSLLLSAGYLLILILLAWALCLFAFRNLKKSGKKNSFFLEKDQAGFVAGKIETDLVGKIGVVVTELKPAGHVRIEEKLYQAVSQGEFLVKGTLVEVISMKGSHVVVKCKK